MANCWPIGLEPLCPVCGVTPLRAKTSRICHPCWIMQQRRKSADRRQAELGSPAPTAASESTTEPGLEPLATYDEAWTLFKREIGMARDRFVPTEWAARDHDVRVVTVLGDLHVPFHDADMLADFVARESDRTDLLVLEGDVADAYSLSRFLQYEHMPFRDEWASVTAVMDTMASAFREIVLIIGNHDSRLEKQLLGRLTGDLVEAVRWLCGGVLCPLTMLAKRYPNVSVARHALPSGHTADWFTTVGDAWIGHPEVFSVTPGGALRKVEQALATHAEEWRLPDYRVIVMGHTHQRGDIPWRHARLIEPGCLCKTQGYQVGPRMSTTTQRRGYVTFMQDANGRTDLNSVRVFDYDEWARLRKAAE